MQESSSARELFGFKLVHLARCWRMRLDQQLKHTGLTQSKWNALVYLTRGGDGLLQKDLARYIGIEGPTLVRLLDDLQRQGLIERRSTHRDRRGKTIHLTDAAYPVLTLTVNVAPDAPSPLVNVVTVEGGGDTNGANNSAKNVVDFGPPPVVEPIPVDAPWMLALMAALLALVGGRRMGGARRR